MVAIVLTFTAAMYPPGVRPAKTDGQAEIAALGNLRINSIKNRDFNRVMSAYVPDNSLFVSDLIPPRQYAGNNAYAADRRDVLTSFRGPIKAELSELQITSSDYLVCGLPRLPYIEAVRMERKGRQRPARTSVGNS
jgi:hypothetical protein